MKIRGALIASAALGLLAAGPSTAAHHEQEVPDQQPSDSEQAGQEEQKPLPPLGDVLRHYALAALGVADDIADWVREAITSPPEWEWVNKDDGNDGDNGNDKDDGNDGEK